MGTNTFTQHFQDEVASTLEKSPYPIESWHASGRASKEFPNKADSDWWLHHGPQMVDRYARWRKRTQWELWMTPDGEPAIELGLDFTLPGGATIKGYIDRVFVLPDGELCVTDVKSGASKQLTTGQLGIYACGIEKRYGVRPKWGTFMDVRKGEHTPIAPLDMWTQDYMGAMFQQFIDAVNKEVFPPSPSNMCGSCSVNKHCSLMGGPEPLDPLHQLSLTVVPY